MTEQEATITVTHGGTEKQLTEKDFLGKSKWQAQGKAEANNLIFRLIRIDDRPMFSYPADTRTDRVCVEIDNAQVTKVTFQ